MAAFGNPDAPIWGDRIDEGPAALMMHPIDNVPRNGTTVMVYCPGETPEHVAAVWAGAKNEDGTMAWEGLMFAEPLLADVCPLGPANATHWYYPPTTETRIHTGAGKIGKMDADAFRREYEGSFDPLAVHEQFTAEQRQVLGERGLRAHDVKVFWIEEWERASITASTSDDIYDDRIQVRANKRRRPCPVLQDFRPGKNDAYIVWPCGKIGLAEWREGSE